MFQRLADAAGVPPIVSTILRRASPTLALAAGVRGSWCKSDSGTRASATMDTYSHVVKRVQHEAAEKVAALLAE
jgi:hypothetical protein